MWKSLIRQSKLNKNKNSSPNSPPPALTQTYCPSLVLGVVALQYFVQRPDHSAIDRLIYLQSQPRLSQTFTNLCFCPKHWFSLTLMLVLLINVCPPTGTCHTETIKCTFVSSFICFPIFSQALHNLLGLGTLSFIFCDFDHLFDTYGVCDTAVGSWKGFPALPFWDSFSGVFGSFLPRSHNPVSNRGCRYSVHIWSTGRHEENWLDAFFYICAHWSQMILLLKSIFVLSTYKKIPSVES